MNRKIYKAIYKEKSNFEGKKMSDLRLQDRVGHRLVSTVNISNPEGYETIVFGGRNRNKIAYLERHKSEEIAQRRHQEIIEDITQNPTKYQLGNLF